MSNVVKMNLIDQFKQTWSTSVENSPKALNYRLYKKGVSFENYLEILKDKDLFLICRFRTSRIEFAICVGVESWETSFIIYSNALNLHRTESG